MQRLRWMLTPELYAETRGGVRGTLLGPRGEYRSTPLGK
jgi:hypothetical protein